MMTSMFNQRLPEDGENRTLVSFITMCNCQQHDFSLVTFNTKDEQRICKYCFEIDDILTWLQKPPKFIKKEIKGIVFDTYCLQDKYGIIDYDLRQKMIALMLAQQIPFRFVPNDVFNSMSMLIAANVNLKLDETILQIIVYKEEIRMFELKRTDFGHVLVDQRDICLHHGYNKDNLKAKIMDKSNPKQIIAALFECSGNSVMKDVRAVLKSKKLTVLGTHVNGFTYETSYEIIKHMYNESENQFHIRSPYTDIFGITDFHEVSHNNDIILTTTEPKLLPFTETKVVSRFTNAFYKAVKDEITQEFFCFDGTYTVPEECHRIKLSLSVDANCYPTINHEAIIVTDIVALPQKLNPETTAKIPVIGFFDNSSVICVWNNIGNCYQFSKSWNDMLGKDLYLDFLTERPTFVDKAEKVSALGGAVYDLIKIMSLPSDNIEPEHHWEFKIDKDADNKVLIEFETFEGYPQAATLAFLMKMILREHIKAIQKETGEKPIKLGFYLFDEFDVEARKRVEDGLEEACKLLNIEFMMSESL